MNKIILASSSPRRKELLKKEGIDFTIDASFIDEVLDKNLDIEDRLIQLAVDKGTPVHLKHYDDIVIAADTTVYHQDKIIGKPKDEQDAREILTSLSDDTHIVYTSVAVFYKDYCNKFIDTAYVTFDDLTDVLDHYIESKEWVGKAGAYGIQLESCTFVKDVKGDIHTVIGLPVQRVLDVIEYIQNTLM